VNPPRYTSTVKNYPRAIYLAWQFLQLRRAEGYSGCFAADLSKWSEMTRLEADFSLRALVNQEMATRRKDGRFFLSNGAMELLRKQELEGK
jgi:hypothetical protein